MKLFNTLTRSIEDFKPIKNDVVGIYTCGPTAYDQVHIGNLRSFVIADTLRRVLTVAGFSPTQVMNITDIDDKTINRSREEFGNLEPMDALRELTRKYTQIFLEDTGSIGNDLHGVRLLKATDHIQEMKTLIKELLNKGIAYIAEDGIYFSIEKYKAADRKYGQLTEISAANTSSARIDNDEYDKASVHDFALWKKHKADEPAWDFDIDGQNLVGRPGWHIECSAMSTKALGQPFDIHTGGVDLIFPHHENEIAQSTGADGEVFANIFVHNEHLLVEGRKMSKSLNNFYTLEDIRAKGYEPLVFRLLVLQSHYRSQADFSWKSLEAALNRLRQLRLMADLRFQAAFDQNAKLQKKVFETSAESLVKTVANDLDTPQALAILNKVEAEVVGNHAVFADHEALAEFNKLLETVDKIFGLQLALRSDLSEKHKKLISDRDAARQDQDWSKSDAIRGELARQRVELLDTPRGTLWTLQDS